MDFIFGTLATDALKQVYHRAFRLGIQHRYTLDPANPRPHEPVTLTAWVGTDCDVDALACYYTTDDPAPSGAYGVSEDSQVARFHQVSTEWDTLAWGCLTRWEVTLPAYADGTMVQYRIGGWREGDNSPEIFANTPDATEITEDGAYHYFSGQEWSMPTTYASTGGKTFAYRVDEVVPPVWAREAIIYQLLVDRFYPGDGADWIQTSDHSQPMGGTLKGVKDKLGYLSDLGINTVWLSPTWISASAHGYDVIDFRTTAPHLGGDAALHRLIEAAHGRGMRVLMDLPCNHLSHQHPIFQNALNSRDSQYREWFTWDVPPHGYKTFFGVAAMPKINLDHPAARDWMLDHARYWLREFDVDGYRLDYASGPSPDFWTYFGAACKEVKPDCFLFGEVIDTPEAQRAYIGRLDGCLDFYTNESLRKTFGWKSQTIADYERQTARRLAHFPADFLMPTFIDSHDMNRFLHIADGDKDALRAALAAQMKLPAPPILYYGTEIGLSHAVSAWDAGLVVGRMVMIWDERQDRALLDDVAALIHERIALHTP
jgi:hypothetical protein